MVCSHAAACSYFVPHVHYLQPPLPCVDCAMHACSPLIPAPTAAHAPEMRPDAIARAHALAVFAPPHNMSAPQCLPCATGRQASGMHAVLPPAVLPPAPCVPSIVVWSIDFAFPGNFAWMGRQLLTVVALLILRCASVGTMLRFRMAQLYHISSAGATTSKHPTPCMCSWQAANPKPCLFPSCLQPAAACPHVGRLVH